MEGNSANGKKTPEAILLTLLTNDTESLPINFESSSVFAASVFAKFGCGTVEPGIWRQTIPSLTQRHEGKSFSKILLRIWILVEFIRKPCRGLFYVQNRCGAHNSGWGMHSRRWTSRTKFNWVLGIFSLTHFGHFVAETFWSLKDFGHLSHSCIKTRRNSVFSLYFQTFWPKWLIFFGHFKNISVCDRIKQLGWTSHNNFCAHRWKLILSAIL